MAKKENAKAAHIVGKIRHARPQTEALRTTCVAIRDGSIVP